MKSGWLKEILKEAQEKIALREDWELSWDYKEEIRKLALKKQLVTTENKGENEND